jgi:2-polyprenyl-3-methyl-5-hydroxy-6-metoxy-1,4-benzoquinol methylase
MAAKGASVPAADVGFPGIRIVRFRARLGAVHVEQSQSTMRQGGPTHLNKSDRP